MVRHVFTLTTLFVLCLAPVVRADDWPEFRGPTGQGLVTNGELPTTWGKDKNVVWKQTIPGKGWSSPVIVGGRVYLTTSATRKESGDQHLEALCLDAANGKIVWEKEIFRSDAKKSPRIHGKNSHASPTPLVRGERLFVHFGHQGTACLDLEGKVLWKNTSLHYAPVHGNGGSPILVEDALVFSCDGGDKRFIAALNVANGDVRWKTDRTIEASRKFSFSTPLLIVVDGKKQIISPGSNVVCAYDPANGREIWRVRYDGYSVIPRPVYGQGLLFICTGYNTPSLLAIRPDGKGDVTDTHVVWKTRKAVPHTPSPLLVGEELYFVSDSGQASCLDARTGQVHWQERLGGNYSASPLFAGGKLYFQSEEGAGVVVQASKEFKLLARNALNERSLASPAAADGALFLRTEKHLYRIGAR
ncbi:MAG TPA: PQQ-binding-like beta-propeller repeat protein [Gemmataceae bacterium]|nr:PQQ-binding-like beta-propeller repeat protein [Gemmataceae bacterium]